MSRTDGNGSARRQQLPDAPSAVNRLEDMKEHRASLIEDIRHHWPGWLGSLAFHAGLLALCLVIVWPLLGEHGTAVDRAPHIDPTSPRATRPLEAILPAPYETTCDLPNITEDVPRPSIDLTDLTPGDNWIGPEGPYGKGLRGPGDDGTGDGGLIGYLDVLSKKGLDVVFVFDSTGSMGGILLEVKTRIRTLIHAMNYFVPGRAQLGLVTYRDLRRYDTEDYEYTVRYQPMVKCNRDGLDKLNTFLRKIEAYGGGDIPEAVYEGIDTAISRMKWRKGSAKVIIVFGDAPPRPERDGLNKIVRLCKRWHEKTGGVVTCIDTTGDHRLREEFKAMAAAGGGQAVSLGAEGEIVKRLIVSMFEPDFKEAIGRKFENMIKGEADPVIRKH